MKQTLTVIAAIVLGTFSFAQAQPPGGPHGGWHLNPLEEMSSTLNLTDAQKAKVQPIVDQAKPQLQAIHQEAMTKAKAVIDASITQIRPPLKPEPSARRNMPGGARRLSKSKMRSEKPRSRHAESLPPGSTKTGKPRVGRFRCAECWPATD